MKVLVTLEIEVHNESDSEKAQECASNVVENLLCFAHNEGVIFNTSTVGFDDVSIESVFLKHCQGF